MKYITTLLVGIIMCSLLCLFTSAEEYTVPTQAPITAVPTESNTEQTDEYQQEPVDDQPNTTTVKATISKATTKVTKKATTTKFVEKTLSDEDEDDDSYINDVEDEYYNKTTRSVPKSTEVKTTVADKNIYDGNGWIGKLALIKWVAFVVLIICIAALIAVNVMYKKNMIFQNSNQNTARSSRASAARRNSARSGYSSKSSQSNRRNATSRFDESSFKISTERKSNNRNNNDDYDIFS